MPTRLCLVRGTGDGTPRSREVHVIDPALEVVLRGRRRVTIGHASMDVWPGEALVSHVRLPTIEQRSPALDGAPYLGVRLLLDERRVAEAVAAKPRLPLRRPTDAKWRGVATVPRDADALAPWTRLLEAALSGEARATARTSSRAALDAGAEAVLLARARDGIAGHVLRAFVGGDDTVLRVRAAAKWLGDFWSLSEPVPRLAARVGLPAQRFSRAFRTITGAGPLLFRRRARLAYASASLPGRGWAAYVGEQHGFASPAQFSREHRRATGRTPCASR